MGEATMVTAASQNLRRKFQVIMKRWEERARKEVASTAGRPPRQLNADRGYVQKKKNQSRRFRKLKRVCIPTKGKTKHPEAERSWFKSGQSMRAGIEAVIGHLKQDHKIDRSRYSGFRGDKINLSLGSLAWNLNKL
jgi:IS5 family transposase